MYKYIVAALLLLFTGCAVDPLDDLDPASDEEVDTGNPEAIHAWLWAYDDESDSLSVIHTIDRECWESFNVHFQPQNGFHTAGLVGGGIYPTLWSWNGEKVFSLTNGILDHGDHGHIVHPRKHVAFSVGSGFDVADMSVTPDGSRIIICGTGSTESAEAGDIVSINCQTGDTSRYQVEHAVSYIVAGSDRIFTGSDHFPVGTILNMEDGSHVTSIATDTLISDGVYYQADTTVFLAGKEGIHVVELNSGDVAETIGYGKGDRVNTFLTAGESDFALGLSGSDDICVVDMKNRTLHRYSVSGAKFAQSIRNGTVVLPDDGLTAIISDRTQSLLYRIALTDGTIDLAAVPEASCQIACNHDGSRVWALTRAKAYQVSFETNSVVDSISVPSGTAWIMVTSFRDNNALFDSNDHTF